MIESYSQVYKIDNDASFNETYTEFIQRIFFLFISLKK